MAKSNEKSVPVVIPTRWLGCHFRSRLEARWAVFFSQLGVQWEYEPEGYELPSGKYLPDFYVSTWDCYFEMKPVYGDHLEKRRDFEKNLKNICAYTQTLHELCEVTSARRGYLVCGTPSYRGSLIWSWDGTWQGQYHKLDFGIYIGSAGPILEAQVGDVYDEAAWPDFKAREAYIKAMEERFVYR